MTKEDKELLFKDLCTRLPYGVVVELDEKFRFNKGTHVLVKELLDLYCVEGIKPYLRSISSMTEEEIHEFQEILGPGIEVGYGFVDIINSSIHTFSFLELQALFDWFNKNMFDYRGLIEKELAIEVNEDNNPYQK